ncbi:MAG: metal transporter, partial [Gammaproteobacteria bacterium]|nr:metal transporter [Gammaproteobacteria bacterium]
NYAVRDDLVTKVCATAANQYIKDDVVECVPFPGGHVAILTSPYNKRSPVNGEFTGKDGIKYRGPVKFQLDISK